MQITVESIDRQTFFDLCESAPPGVSVKLGGTIRKDFGDQVVVAVITFAGSVAVNLVAQWLYDKIKGKPAKLTINRRQVDIKDGEVLVRLIEEEITKE
jgi:hypothetical protein